MKNKIHTTKVPANSARDHNDITELMLAHHRPLKSLIKAMKDENSSLSTVRAAYDKFAPLLEAHAVPEQDSLYERMRDASKRLRVESFEGFTEHEVADQLAKEIHATPDDDAFRAKVKVLAEAVEHHIDEEEETMIPEIRKTFSADERTEIGLAYLGIRARYGIEKAAA